jgi:uncharacterized protein (DUF305 family)
MKNLRWTLILPLVYLFLISCKDHNDDDTSVQTVPRDQNESLKVMNSMNSKIDTINLSGHADVDFGWVMVVHHQGAIDLANLELKNGDDATIKAKAQDILNRKTIEKDSISMWLIGRKPTREAIGEHFDSLMMASIDKWKNLDAVNLNGDADHDFAELMIVHSKTVVEVAQEIIQLGHHDDMKARARQMVVNENQVVTDLEAWLSTNSK